MDILNVSLSASLLISVIITLRVFFVHRLPKKTFLVLWGLAVCRLLQPFSIPSRLSIWSLIDIWRGIVPKEVILPAETPMTGIFNNIAADAMPLRLAETVLKEPALTTPDNGANAAMTFFFWIWLVGLCFCVLYFLITHLLCYRNVYQTALPVENTFVQEWLQAHPTRRKLSVRISDKISSPLTYGIFKPVMLLPKATDWSDKNLLSYILTHEYVHIIHFDILWKWLLTAVLSLHWFNPLVWLMYLLANRDIELRCDETVVRIFGEGIRSAYALTLISLAGSRNKIMPLCNNFSRTSIEERLLSIMKIKKVSSLRNFTAVIAVSGIGLFFATSAPNADAAQHPYLGYVERMFFATKGETMLKVTYDGKTWEPYSYIPVPPEEEWRWYSYDEYKEYMDIQLELLYPPDYVFTTRYIVEDSFKELEKHLQTLTDIKHGIKVSKDRTVYLVDQSDPRWKNEIGEIKWRCFGYSFRNKFGREVDLGLFETRDELFAALKQYYDREVSIGNLTQKEGDDLYNSIAHQIRNDDEVPLLEKLRNSK